MQAVHCLVAELMQGVLKLDSPLSGCAADSASTVKTFSGGAEASPASRKVSVATTMFRPAMAPKAGPAPVTSIDQTDAAGKAFPAPPRGVIVPSVEQAASGRNRKAANVPDLALDCDTYCSDAARPRSIVARSSTMGASAGACGWECAVTDSIQRVPPRDAR